MSTSHIHNQAVCAPGCNNCVLPYQELYTLNSVGPQSQINAEYGNELPSDLQVQLALTGYGGQMRRGASDIEMEETHPDFANINDFGPLTKGAGDPFKGRPTATRAAKYMFQDVRDSKKLHEINWGGSRIKKPDIRDFAQKMPIGYRIGSSESVTPGAKCVCVLPETTPWSSVRAVMLSQINGPKLYDALVEAGLILGMDKLLVYEPNTQPCICSYVGTDYAQEFVNFTFRFMGMPSSQEFDIQATMEEQNRIFAQQLLAQTFTAAQQKQIVAYDRAAGKLRGLQPRPEREADAPELAKSVECLGSSNLPQASGGKFLDNKDTAVGGYLLSRPSSIFHHDARNLTGLPMGSKPYGQPIMR